MPCLSSYAIYYDCDNIWLQDMGLGGGRFMACGVSGNLLAGDVCILFPYNQTTGFTYDGGYNIINTNSSTINVRVFDYTNYELYYGRFQSMGSLQIRSNNTPYSWYDEDISYIMDMNFKLLGDDYDVVAQNIFWNDTDIEYLVITILGLGLFILMWRLVYVRKR